VHPFLKKVLSPLIFLRRYGFQKKVKYFKEFRENLVGILDSDPIISLSDFGGKFQVDPRSDLFKRAIVSGSYEPDLVRLCLKHLDRERSAIDVGANIGFYTILFARELQKGVVLAIEPVPSALKKLRKNIGINSVASNVLVYEGAATNYGGYVEINTIEGKEEYSSLGKIVHASVRSDSSVKLRVKCTTIDQLTNQYRLNPGFIKIDAEGAEHKVLEGCNEVLRKNRPTLLVECSEDMLRQNGSSVFQLINFLEEYHYQVINPLYPGISIRKRRQGNLLCIPAEMS